MKIKAFVLAFLVLTLSLSLTSGLDEVSDPGRVNKLLGDFTTPIIEPSSEGTLSFNLTNPYEEDMGNVRVRIEIYAFATLDEEKDITLVDSPPTFAATGETYTSFSHNVLVPNQAYPRELRINTNSNTEKGVYFLRFEMEFEYLEESYLMRSKGHFSDEDWDYATRRPGTSDEPYYSGSINITYLQADGIIPDSSFTVKTPIPRWPQFLLGGLAAFFGIFAVMLYMQEEYNSFPWLEKTLNKWSGKFQQLRRRLEYRLRKR